jgi:WD40 repeat protein
VSIITHRRSWPSTSLPMARWCSLEVRNEYFHSTCSLTSVGRDACVVIWSMIKRKLFQPPIPRFLEGPVRSVAWVDFGLGPGNAFVSGHSDGRVVVYSRSKDQVRALPSTNLPQYVLSSVAVQGDLREIHWSSPWCMGLALGRPSRSLGIHRWWDVCCVADQ